jgi:hypothetical protein
VGWQRIAGEVRQLAAKAPWLVRHPADLATAATWIRGDGFQLDHPVPWWPRRAVRYVARELPVNARVFEFGAGASTLWLQSRGAHVTSVEHDEAWFDLVHRRTAAAGAQVLLRAPTSEGQLRSGSAPGCFDDYVAALAGQGGDYDLIIVDGRCRVACATAAAERVRPGGMLLLDDSDREKYRPAHELLRAWPATHLRGIKPGSRDVCQTTVWRRPPTATSAAGAVPVRS